VLFFYFCLVNYETCFLEGGQGLIVCFSVLGD